MDSLAFWIVAAVISLGVGGLLIVQIRNQRQAAQHGAPDATKKELQVYREQLRETERDLSRGAISQTEAERLRIEIGRRLLDADKSAARDAKRQNGTLLLPSLCTAACVAGAFALYLNLGAPGYPDMPLQERLNEADERMKNRPPQAEAMAGLAPLAAPPADAEFTALMEKLRQAVDPATSQDPTGLELLARNEAILGNFETALAAQNRLIELKADQATAADHLGHADLLIRAAQGYVSPEAEAALKEVLRREPKNELALYYSGMMFAQAGRFDRTFALWRPLAESGDPKAPFMDYLRQELPEIAQLAGVKYNLPAARGPSAEDIAAAQDMSQEDRKAMIEGMVNQLSERLATQGGTPAEWAQLIRALGVLGNTEDAAKIYAEAMVVFDVQPEAKAEIDAAARQAGVIK